MSQNIYVGNLSYSVSEETLKDLFSNYGSVESVKVITDKYTGRAKGFAFVVMENKEEADKAISELDGSELEGRNMKVNIAKPKEERGNSYGGGNNNRRSNNYQNRY